MRNALLTLSAIAASLSACGPSASERDVSAQPTMSAPAAAQHWEPAPVTGGALPSHPRNSAISIGPSP